jgi:two-component system chemotaxis response regulator CheB
LIEVLEALPADFPHAVLVVLHLSAHHDSVLASILDRRCALRVRVAADGEPVRAGHVHVAPPDLHLSVRGPLLGLDAGPLENCVRPAVDPMLRSLAVTHGLAAVAVVLSGALGDGAAGAQAVAAGDGRVLVQDPEEATVSSMPSHAIAAVRGAEVLTAARIGAELARMGPPPTVAARSLARSST